MMAAEVNLDREKPPSRTFPPPPPGPDSASRRCGARRRRKRGMRPLYAHLFRIFYQTPARGMVVVSAYGGKAQEIRYKISLHAD